MARRFDRQARRAKRTRRGGDPGWQRYRMTQKLISIGDDYDVENAAGERVFTIDGKALRVRDTLKMTDVETGDTYRIKERVVRVMDTMTIHKNGQRAAAVKKAVVTPIRDRFTVLIPGASNLKVKGNVLAHEYQMSRDGERVAVVSKKWFRVRDSYGVEVAPGMDAGLVIAMTVALDMMAHPSR
ncbi:LURP-one-related/scramblase family protein [Salinigranum marinum]|uniref:LURP-one-related/scramblase family protein n=1 Tax=Salinigranum marinum TaxID=1515595 RepID=UPI002989ECEF|nr:LURP-one-related family protein [Salinigranum marinum]